MAHVSKLSLACCLEVEGRKHVPDVDMTGRVTVQQVRAAGCF